MESRVYFDPQPGIVVVEVVGAVTGADLDELRQAVVEQKQLHTAELFLVDLSRMNPSDLSSELVRSRARDSWESFRRIAHVAPRDAVFGLARMYELTAGDRPGTSRAAFRSRNEAVRWLTE